IAHNAISQTSKYLAQVGDFCYALLRTANNGNKLGEGELANLQKLQEFSQTLSADLRQLTEDVSKGNIDWSIIKNQGSEILSAREQSPVTVKFEKMSESMQQYPTLIYDG